MRANPLRAHEKVKDEIEEDEEYWGHFRQGTVDHQILDGFSRRQKAMGAFVVIAAAYVYFVRGSNRPPWGA